MEVDEDTGEIVEGRHVRPFAEWLIEQRKGALASELSDHLNTVVDAVNTYHKAGSVTLTIKIKPAHRGEGMVLVIDDVTVKMPEAEREEILYFINKVELLKSPMYARNPGIWKRGRVIGFARRSRAVGPWDLLYRALHVTVGSRSKRDIAIQGQLLETAL